MGKITEFSKKVKKNDIMISKGSNFATVIQMEKKILYFITCCLFILGCISLKAQQSERFSKKILYFNPEIEPDIEEIKEPTYDAFFTHISEEVTSNKKTRIMRTEAYLPYDNVDIESISEYTKNNDADFLVLSKIKYFKVGIGKYVFSNQVLVSMKLYNSDGILIAKSEYDTYKKNMRILGSTKNSIKIGTQGALSKILKKIKFI